ncbi:MAG: hypothetical protein ACI976_001417 [Aureispira sp.]|jgi:hypothetical protein
MKDSLTKLQEDGKQSISTDQVNEQPQTSGHEDLSEEALRMGKFQSQVDGKQSILTDQVNEQSQTSGHEDLSEEALRMGKFQSQVDGNEERQDLSKPKGTINKDLPLEKSDNPEVKTTKSVANNPQERKKAALEKQKASVERLSKGKGNKNVANNPEGKTTKSVASNPQEKKAALEKQKASVERLSKGKENKNVANNPEGETTKSVANNPQEKKAALEKQKASAIRLSHQPNENKKTKKYIDEDTDEEANKSIVLEEPVNSDPVKTLSQPNENVIAAGNEKKDGSSEQQDMQIAALLADAGKALGPFATIFEELKVVTKASTAEINQQKKVKYLADDPKVLDKKDPTKEGDFKYNNFTGKHMMKTVDSEATSLGGMKGEKRIKQKMNTKYAKAKKKAVNEINDVVRGTFAFEGFKEMLDALGVIEKYAGVDYGNFSYKIERVKQIYTPISELLYGDVKFNLNVNSNDKYKGEAFNHNCELQLNTIEMLKGKGTKIGHGAYEKWRNLDEEHWKKEGRELPKKIKDMTDDSPTYYRSKARQAIHDSLDAYKAAEIGRQEDKENFDKVIAKVKEMGGNKIDLPAEALGEKTLEETATATDANYGKFIANNNSIIEDKK